ncbi:unnamed protein product [Somion occarium]|uniref:GPI mannosyltransferase 2 n=1 Tax=Somion occarium TaxID=3059160 RepID=A0ABP1DJL3_9APHY
MSRPPSSPWTTMSTVKRTTSKPDALSSARIASDLRLIRVLSVSTWLLSALLVHLASYLPLFDSSPQVVLGEDISRTVSPLLRWDAFHFGHIAKHGYVYEYEWAFFAGTPLVMRKTAQLCHLLGLFNSEDALTWPNILFSGASIACLCGTASTLYELTLELTASPSFALLSSLLSLLPSSPATLRLAPYTEPFFTYLSYKGMLSCARARWTLAAIFFTLAGVFRSNGFMLSGFLLWGMVIDPILSHRNLQIMRITHSAALTALTFVPFLSHQLAAYLTFCRDNTSPAAWCSKSPPFVYSYVQSKYWNVGFLRYWTLSQLPNFLLSMPVIVLLLWASSHHIRHILIPHLHTIFYPSTLGSRPMIQSSPFLTTRLIPHAVHAFIFTNILLFASHTQIILRLAASMPFTYWAAAYLVMEYPKAGRAWVTWSVVWGAVSLVLWTTFLPPA